MSAPGALAVTGASGFLGRHLCREIQRRGLPLVALGRRAGEVSGAPVIDAGENFCALAPSMLSGVQALVHCAARVHQLSEERLGQAELQRAYREANVEAALRCARAARAAHVRRFVFVSSVHVHARATPPAVTLTAASPMRPQSPYARSKAQAERALEQYCRDEGLELVIVRPTLVYGAGVKAKFAQLVDWVARGRPLPFGALRRNRRSFVSAANLADLLILTARHEKAAGRAWLAADAQPVSTAQLIEAIARACGVRARNWPVPPALLRLGLALIGRSGVLEVLDGSLAVDIADNRNILGWQPPQTLEQGLAAMFEDEGPGRSGAAGRAQKDLSS